MGHRDGRRQATRRKGQLTKETAPVPDVDRCRATLGAIRTKRLSNQMIEKAVRKGDESGYSNVQWARRQGAVYAMRQLG